MGVGTHPQPDNFCRPVHRINLEDSPDLEVPKINPGETLVVDYYVTGSHPEDSPPEYVWRGLADFPIESVLEEPDTAGESSPR